MQASSGADEYRDCTYYRWVDPSSYYLSILGVYLYQLFFVGMRSNTVSKPAGVQSLEGQLKASPSLRPHLVHTVSEILDTKAFQEHLSPGARFSNLYRRLTALYLVLTIHDLRSVLGEKPLEELNYKWMEVANDIAECFGKSKGYFHDSLDFKSFARTFADRSTGNEAERGKQNEENAGFGAIELNLTHQIGEIIRTTWAF
jgi:hypothetical protein